MPRQEPAVADKARGAPSERRATQRWRELVIRGAQDRHVLVAKPQPELMARGGMPPSTNEGAASITVSQAKRVRVRAGLSEPVLGVQFSVVGKWQPHSYSNQRRHSEPFSFQWGQRVNRLILSGRQFCWKMEGCVLSACSTAGRWAKGATLWDSSAGGFHISTADSSYGKTQIHIAIQIRNSYWFHNVALFQKHTDCVCFVLFCSITVLLKYFFLIGFKIHSFQFRNVSWGRVLCFNVTVVQVKQWWKKWVKNKWFVWTSCYAAWRFEINPLHFWKRRHTQLTNDICRGNRCVMFDVWWLIAYLNSSSELLKLEIRKDTKTLD